MRGVSFTASRGILGAIVRVATIAILARLLTPGDFGLVAAIIVIQQLITMLIQRGIGDALVQRPDLNARDAGTALTILVGTGALCAAAFWMYAADIEWLIGLPNAADAIRVIGLAIFIEATLQVYLSDARRELQFEWIALIEALAIVIGYSAISIGLALLGFGYWALIGGVLGQSSVRLIGFAAGSWRCCRPCLSTTAARRLFGFSAMVTLWTAAGHVFSNVDRIIIARYLGADAVGYFSRAKNFVALFIEFYGLPVNQVLFPVLSKLQDEPARLFNAYRHAISFSALLGLPSALGVCALAAPLVELLLGDQWGASVPLVRVLAFTIFFQIVAQPFVAIVRGMGRLKEPLILTIVQAIAMVVGVLALYPYGLVAVAIYVVILNVIGFLVSQMILAKTLEVTVLSLILPMRAGLIYACVIVAMWIGVTFIIGLSTDVMLGAAIFAVLSAAGFLVLFFAVPNWFLQSDLMWTHELGVKFLRNVCRKIPDTRKLRCDQRHS